MDGDGDPGKAGHGAAGDGGAAGAGGRRAREDGSEPPAAGSGSEAAGGFRRWVSRPEVLVGIAAMILSLCGLFISIHETMLVRQEQRASVWPRVELGTSFSGANRVRFHVRNTGVGPARVRAVSVSHRGETLDGWGDLLRSVAGEEVELQGRSYSLLNGRVLPPGSQREAIFEIDEDDVVSPDDLIRTLQQAILDGSVDVATCYCSVYDECWKTALQGLLEPQREEEVRTGAIQVESCEGAPRSGI